MFSVMHALDVAVAGVASCGCGGSDVWFLLAVQLCLACCPAHVCVMHPD